jgi:hypothetical protein
MFSLGFGELVVLALCLAGLVMLGGVGGAVFRTLRGRARR